MNFKSSLFDDFPFPFGKNIQDRKTELLVGLSKLKLAAEFPVGKCQMFFVHLGIHPGNRANLSPEVVGNTSPRVAQ